MKKLLILICLIMTTSFSYCQESEIIRYRYKKDYVDIPFKDGKILFSKIIYMDGVEADKIYSCVKSVIPSLMHTREDKKEISVKGSGYSRSILYSGSTHYSGSASATVHEMDLNSSVLIENKEHNTITIRSWIHCYFKSRSTPFKVWFTMRVECKDGRYRMLIYDLVAKNPPRSGLWEEEEIDQDAILVRGIRKNNELMGYWGVSMISFPVAAHEAMGQMQTEIEAILKSKF